MAKKEEELTRCENFPMPDIPDRARERLEAILEDDFKFIPKKHVLLGSSTICRAIITMITTFEGTDEKLTLNDYRGFVKDMKGFCINGVRDPEFTIRRLAKGGHND